MRKILLWCLLIICVVIGSNIISAEAEENHHSPQNDSRELQLQDMLATFLLPHIEPVIIEYYSDLVNTKPVIYPYDIEIVDVTRLNGFRGFIFTITLDVLPVVGPHIGLGEDRIAIQIGGPEKVKLLKHEHLKSYELPPNYQPTFQPSHAKWGRLAMREVIQKYDTPVVDYLHVGRKRITPKITQETFKFLLKDETREFGVYVYIQFESSTENIISIKLEQIKF